MPNLTEHDLLLKIAILEVKLEENEKRDDKTSKDLENKLLDCNEQLEKLRCKMCEMCNKGDGENIRILNNQLNEIEEQVDSIREELPEIRLIKQLVMGLTAIILTSFVGFVWNNLIDDAKPIEHLGNGAKKIIEEYKNGDKK